MKIHTVFFATFLLTQSLSAADPKELSLRWSELEPAVAGGKVRIVLPNGPRIEGRVVAVEPQALRIRITKTSDRNVHPKGETLIPRTAVSVVQVVRFGVRWRIFGTVTGPLLVAAAGASAAALGIGRVEGLGKSIGVGLALYGGAGVGGYYLGKRADRHVAIIRIVPQSEDVHDE